MNHVKSWCLVFFLCDLLLVIFACNCYFCLWFNPNKWYQSEVVFFSYPLQESLTVEWESHSQVGEMADEGKLRVYRFNGQNFQLWKMQMEDYLYHKDLYVLLNGKTNKSVSMKDEEWDILDKKTL